jgi:tyrosyl-tRNA synthetase
MELEKCQGNELNKVKIRLADEATGLLHGKECLESIHSTVYSLFNSNSNSKDLDALEKIKLSIDNISNINNNGSILVVDLLLLAGLTKSKAEGKRHIKGGGIRINDERILEDSCSITSRDFDSNGRLKLSLGKKKHVLIEIS